MLKVDFKKMYSKPFNLESLQKNLNLMRIECKLNYRFCLRITTYKCQDKKSNG